MLTVLVLDSQAPSVALKLLEGLACIPVVVDDVARARHVLLNLPVDLWICDLAVGGLDFRQLHAEAGIRNASARILLTGTPVTHLLASALIKEKRADQFLPKPWKPMAIKHAVFTLLQQPDHPSTAGGGKTAEPPSRHIVTPRGVHLRVKSAAALPPSATSPTDGDEGRYRLDELLGQGGMGRVYRAHDRLLDMEVAVKLLNPEFTRDEQAIALLKEETRICLQLLHRHVVRIYNLERRQELLMIIMEYVRGASLYTLLAQRPGGFPLEMVQQIVAVMTDALGYAHHKGVLHKDITPGNVLFSDDGVLKLIDFGIADRMNRQHVVGDDLIGTPVYMSPEQLRGEPLDVRTDVYSLGVLTHQMLTGRLPSLPGATVETLASQPHPPLVGLPDGVREVLEWALAFDRDGRCPSIEAFGHCFAETRRRDDADHQPSGVATVAGG